MMTHYVPYFASPIDRRGRLQAVCGEYVNPRLHSTEPSCKDCVAWLEQDAPVSAASDDTLKEERTQG